MLNDEIKKKSIIQKIAIKRMMIKMKIKIIMIFDGMVKL
jgi:hypothetical protein